VPDKVTANAAVRDGYRAVQRFVATAHLTDAVLLLPRRGDLGFLSDTPFLENDPSLDQPVLYAEDRGPADLVLAHRYPDPGLYRFSEDLPRGATTGGRLRLDRLRVETGASVTLRLRLTNPTDRPVAVAYLTDGHRTEWRTLDEASSRGRGYDVSWTVAAPGAGAAPGATGGRLPVAPPAGVLVVGVDLRPAGAAERRGERWEQRIPYRLVDGGTEVETLRPGQGWHRADRPRAVWVPAATGNPVENLG
jgi:hypothetical protein